MGSVSLRIDGQDLVVDEADTILAAAARGGLADRIPTLCFVEGSRPEGGCRLCIVRVDGSKRPVAACATRVRAGMSVETSAPEIEDMRRDILRLIIAAHPKAGEPDQRGGGRESARFGALLTRYGLAQADSPGEAAQRRTAKPQSHPYLRFDADLCITCRRCLQVCDDRQGQFVFAIGERGGSVRLLFGENEQFATSPCVSCGACVEVCPTGALSDADRAAPMPADSFRTVRSVCGYCGVGCNVDVAADAARILSISGTQESSVNTGHLCAKGRYAHGWSRSPERLTRPLLRDGRDFREVSWTEAMAWAATRIGDIRRSHGADALGLLTSSRSTNEAAYLLQKTFRVLVGTNNVDCCARVCHSSTALALSLATGAGAASASYADIERASTIVVAGANATEAHPVVGARIKQAARRGARLVVIDPRSIELSRYADLHLQIEPGGNVPLFNAIASILLEEDLIDRPYVLARTEGLEELREHLKRISLAGVAAACGLPIEAIREAARLIAGRGPALFVTGLGLSELTEGTASVLALINVALLTGSIGRPGAGMLPLRGQNNVQGNADMGSAPDVVTGYQRLSDPVVRQRLAEVWGSAPPVASGLTIPEMLAGARAGRIRGLWIQGEDVVQSDPHEAAVIEALERLDLLVVQEIFMSETARYAHLVLPAAGVFEQDGTFTNGERRIQRVRQVLAPPGEARADWRVALDLSRALGATWQHADPGDIMREIATVAPHLFGGVSYDRLDGDGLQWPCPTPDHPGTATVHRDAFVRGKGRLSVIEPAPTPERRSNARPFLLITGRQLQHYNVGTMTRRTPNMRLVGRDTLVLNPADATALGLAAGDRAAVESAYGRVEVPVSHGDDVKAGTAFLSFHFPETHTNALTGPLVDPQSKCPEYKITAVQIARAI